MEIGYFADSESQYLIKIKVIKKEKHNTDDDNNKQYKQYLASKYIILSITNYITNENITDSEYEIDKENNNLRYYNIDPEVATCNNIYNQEDILEYLKNKSGMFRKYYTNGMVMSEYFHNNGIIEGESKAYTDFGKLYTVENYVNGELTCDHIYYDYSDTIIEVGDINGIIIYFDNGDFREEIYIENKLTNEYISEYIMYKGDEYSKKIYDNLSMDYRYAKNINIDKSKYVIKEHKIYRGKLK